MSTPMPPEESTPKPGKGDGRWWRKRWVQITIGGLIVFLIGSALGASGKSSNNTTTTSAPVLPAPTATVTTTMPVPGQTATVSATVVQTATATVTTTYTPTPVTAFAGDGEYLVGSDVKPGTYKSPGGSGGPCYADTQDQGGNILNQEVGSGQVILVVSASAYRIDVRGCQDFTAA